MIQGKNTSCYSQVLLFDLGTDLKVVDPVKSEYSNMQGINPSSPMIRLNSKSWNHSNGHITSSRWNHKGVGATGRTPKQLSLAYFIARTRLVQKFVTVSLNFCT